MKKPELNAQEIHGWMRNRWELYASLMYDKKLLRLWVSGQGKYRVMHGEETLYKGFQVTGAIAAWDKA